MLAKTRFFGEVDIEEEKILTFDNGIMGFEDMKYHGFSHLILQDLHFR